MSTSEEFTGPFTAADWLAGSTVRFADNGGATLDLVKAPHRIRYTGPDQREHTALGRREDDADTSIVRFRLAPWAMPGPGTAVAIVPAERVLEVEERGDVIATGMVNGPAVACYEDGTPVPDDGGDDVALARPDHWLVPCWTAREGREPTTVYVDSRNVLGVVHPAPYSPATGRPPRKRSR